MKTKNIKLIKFKYLQFKNIDELINITKLDTEKIDFIILEINNLINDIKDDNEVLQEIYIRNTKIGYGNIKTKGWLYYNDISKKINIEYPFLKINYEIELGYSNRYIYPKKVFKINDDEYRTSSLKGVLKDLEKLKNFINKLIIKYGTTKQKIKLI